jgi:uncharacterized protein (TIGR02145 family)
MNYFLTFLKSKTFGFGFLIVALIGCEVTEPVLNPDYTGQKGQITDVQGNVYKTIGIGSQIWMAENLKTTQLNNGKILTDVKNDSNWHYFINPAYCYYNNDSIQFHKNYGPLYNFAAVNTDSICPVGWRVPTSEDWNTLADFIGGTQVAGGKLKDFYGNFWNSPNHCISNNYNFSAIPGGYRKFDTGLFSNQGDEGFWWTSTSIPNNSDHVWVISMSKDKTQLNTNSRYKNEGVNIRCIKNK